MSEREYSENEENTEASEVEETQETPEARQLEQATHEAEAHVEATQTYQEAEQIEASVTGLVEEAAAPDPGEAAKDEISATPIPLPIPAPVDELSTAQVDAPGGAIDPIDPAEMPGTHEGATAREEGKDPTGEKATPNNLPGPQDEISATPINTPEPVPPDGVVLESEGQAQSQDLTGDPIRELDVQLPEHGLKQPEG
ncbi:MAG: hypothetical protein ABFS17_07795, partial [Chloroflexota bacterium]